MQHDPGPAVDPLESFHDELQELVIDQARRMINLNLYNKALLSALPVALLGTDKQGRVRTANRAAEETLGMSEKDLRGRELDGLFPAGSETARRIRQALTEGRPAHMAAENLRLASGGELVGNLYLQPLRDDEEKVCGLLLTIEDRTYVHYLHSAFQRYVPPSVSEIIARDPRSLQLGGEERELSVLFSDLIGFTSLCEGLPPQEMVTLLSDYFAEMTAHVFAFEGTLKEYVGDELMAIFGAPVAQEDHAAKACRTALAMRENLCEIRRSWPAKGRPALRARIGVNSGPMLVGNLGSPYRFAYGVVGDQVNLASRLEGLSGRYGVDILLGENTADLLGREFVLREIDAVRVKGRETPVRIYELVDTADRPLDPRQAEALERYATGLAGYRRQQWDAAYGHFTEIGRLWPADRCGAVMAERCRIYRRKPPRPDWDGVFDHQVKK